MEDCDATGRGDLDEPLERLLAILERARRIDPPRVNTRARDAELTYAAQLLQLLASIAPELPQATGSHAWQTADALRARVMFEIYDRAVRELRVVALGARVRIEQAEAVLAEARDFSRRRRRRAMKIAARLKTDG